MTRTLAHIDALPPHLRADARRKAEQATLRPTGTAHQITRVLLISPDEEFSMREVKREYDSGKPIRAIVAESSRSFFPDDHQ